MGSVFGSIGSALGATFGGIPGAIAGAIGGGGGGGLSDMLGINNQYRASNPYAPSYLQGMAANQGQIYGQQQSLAQALQQQMAGNGPNPAQTQFMANQQSNIANAQGLIASQRGLNPALAARMGANQATAANQQAGLGSALLQQQQQLGATSNLGNLYGQMQQGNLGYQQLYTGAENNAQKTNANIATGNTNRNAQLEGSVINSIGGVAGKAATGAAHGAIVPGHAQVAGDSTQNDTVNAKLSPGEIVVPRSAAHDPEKAKEFIDALFKDNGDKKDIGYGDVLKARNVKKKAKS